MERSMKLAVDGGTPVRTGEFPLRRVFGSDDRAAVDAFFGQVIETGDDFRYGGASQRAYEAEFADFHGGGHALLVSSGTAALYVALGALGLQRPGEVIVPAITDAGGVMPVPLQGLVPVVADTEPSSFNVGVEQIEQLLSPWTRAVLVAHIGGRPVDIEPVVALARRHGLPVIEDCSQAHGAIYHGQKVGTFGDVAIFSTMSNKHHCTGGQGGVVFTRDSQLFERIIRCADRGKSRRGDMTENVVAALNFNGNDLSAVIGRSQLARLPDRLTARRQVARLLADGLQGLEATRIEEPPPDTNPAYWFVRLQLDLESLGVSRAEHLHALRAEGIPAGLWADIPATHDWFERQVLKPDPSGWPLGEVHRARTAEGPLLPNATAAADSHINLFVHEQWTAQEVEDSCRALAKLEAAFLGERPGRGAERGR